MIELFRSGFHLVLIGLWMLIGGVISLFGFGIDLFTGSRWRLYGSVLDYFCDVADDYTESL